MYTISGELQDKDQLEILVKTIIFLIGLSVTFKLVVEKCLIMIIKVTFQRQKSSEFFWTFFIE